jgi:quercetin dioxygenase-like cupin family protein
MPVFKQKETTPEKITATLERRIAYINNLMVTVCDFTNGPAPKPDPPHSHLQEQITYVAEGDLFLCIGDEKHQLTTGDVFTVPSGLPHCIQTISKLVRVIDCFSPIREDFLKKGEK